MGGREPPPSHEPVFTLLGHGFSWRDLILLAGGLFLIWKATKEIHHNVDPDAGYVDLCEACHPLVMALLGAAPDA